MDYYKVLGVSKSASQEEIKKAFHKLAHKHHPHKGGDEKKFKEINEAYQILSNKEKRAQYDKFGRVFEGPSAASGEGFGQEGFSWNWGGGDIPDMEFESDLGDLGDILGDIFGFRAKRSKRSDLRRGEDIKVDLELSLEEVLKETVKEIFLYKKVLCSRCGGKGAEPGAKTNECFSCRGSGQVQQIKKTFFGSFTQQTICPECGGEGQKPDKLCNVCKGEGRIKEKEKIRIYIPAGVDNNQILELKGKGNAGKRGGKPGNLYIRIIVREHPIYERKGDDLYLSLPIAFSQAALGDEIEILTLDRKKILLKAPSGTESGKILRISGKGIPHFSGYGRGHLYVQLKIKTPKKLSKKQKELLKKLKEEGM